MPDTPWIRVDAGARPPLRPLPLRRLPSECIVLEPLGCGTVRSVLAEWSEPEPSVERSDVLAPARVQRVAETTPRMRRRHAALPPRQGTRRTSAGRSVSHDRRHLGSAGRPTRARSPD